MCPRFSFVISFTEVNKVNGTARFIVKRKVHFAIEVVLSVAAVIL